MTNVRKRTGKVEEFSKEKLQRSIKAAGAPESAAMKIASDISPVEGMTTAVLREQVGKELERVNPTLSKNYLYTRRLTAKKTENISEGVAKINTELMASLPIDGRSPVKLVAGPKELKVSMIGQPDIVPQNIALHQSDMAKLGIAEGTRIAIVYPTERTQ